MKIAVLTIMFMISGHPIPPAYVGAFVNMASCENYKAALLKAKPERQLTCSEDALLGK